MKNKEKIFNILTILWILFIWGQSLLPGEVSGSESGAVFNFLKMFIPFLTHHMVRKAAHFTEYFILGSFINKKLYIQSALICLFVAVVDESIQLFTADRGSNIVDVWIDFAGAVSAIFIFLLIKKIRKK